MKYTGVGSRRAPTEALELAEKLALQLRREGWTLRSGHAPGMDQAFERGAQRRAEVYLPWPTFEEDVPLYAGVIWDRPSARAYELGMTYHPSGWMLKPAVKRLMARNLHQVLGPHLGEPSRFVVCWTPDGSLDGKSEDTGGTGQALRVAAAYRIPVFNLAREEHLARCLEYVHGSSRAQ
jgi:hypothetical protein